MVSNSSSDEEIACVSTDFGGKAIHVASYGTTRQEKGSDRRQDYSREFSAKKRGRKTSCRWASVGIHVTSCTNPQQQTHEARRKVLDVAFKI